MFSNQTPNYGLPQWENDDKPTWLTDMNEAFANIDENLKRVEEMAEEGGVPQEIIDRIVALETSVTNIVAQIGNDVIDTIGTSITNAIVNLKSAIDTATTNITNILTKIGDTNISDVGNSITQAIRNLADTGVPQTIIDRITALETSVTNIVAQIGNDVIDTIGTSITNAIINLKSAVDTATTNITNILTKIGNDVITGIGTSITNALVNLNTSITNITTQIGNTNISDMGDTITEAIRNLIDWYVSKAEFNNFKKSVFDWYDRIVALEKSVTNILTTIGADAISGIGTSITNAIVNLNTAITNITTQIGNTSISDIGDTITQAIRNLADTGVPQTIVDRIVALETSVTNILTQIGNDVITGIGTSITNALVNLKNRIDNIMTLIGDVDISSIGTSITNAIVNLKNLIDTKLNKNWSYVGILSASTGSTITVGDDWTELLLAIRVSEGSSYYNLTNVLPKEGFTRGNPNGNQTFAGFFWNDSYNAKLRLGLEGTGNNRKLKLNFSNAIGWDINGIYVLKR